MINIMACQEVVHHWGHNMPPFSDETNLLVSTHRWLPWTFVSDTVPASGEYFCAAHVVRVFLGGIVTIPNQDRWMAFICGTRLVENDWSIEAMGSSDIDSLPRDLK